MADPNSRIYYNDDARPFLSANTKTSAGQLQEDALCAGGSSCGRSDLSRLFCAAGPRGIAVQGGAGAGGARGMGQSPRFF